MCHRASEQKEKGIGVRNDKEKEWGGGNVEGGREVKLCRDGKGKRRMLR